MVWFLDLNKGHHHENENYLIMLGRFDPGRL